MSTDIECTGINDNNRTEVAIERIDRRSILLASKSSKSFFKSSPSPIKTGGNTRISLNDIPPELAAKLRHLDLGNDGYLDLEDILVLDERELHDKKTMKFYRRLFIILVVVFILQIAAVFAVSFAAINASKDSYVTNNVLQTKSGAAVQTASVEYCTTPNLGLMVLRNSDGSCPSDNTLKPPAIATSISTVDITLTSDLPYEALSELKSLYLVSPTGAEVFVTVNGYIRTNGDVDDLILITDIGDLTLTGSDISFTDTTPEKYFKLAGFSTVSVDGTTNRRRLQVPAPSVKPTARTARHLQTPDVRGRSNNNQGVATSEPTTATTTKSRKPR